jgi:hypothetical protein
MIAITEIGLYLHEVHAARYATDPGYRERWRLCPPYRLPITPAGPTEAHLSDPPPVARDTGQAVPLPLLPTDCRTCPHFGEALPTRRVVELGLSPSRTWFACQAAKSPICNCKTIRACELHPQHGTAATEAIASG